jgi:pilus assembly protein Flp/PilA
VVQYLYHPRKMAREEILIGIEQKPKRIESALCETSDKEKRQTMSNPMDYLLRLKIWKDQRGQDLIEYALMAGFVAVAAGSIMPGVATSISKIFSKISSSMTAAANQGS